MTVESRFACFPAILVLSPSRDGGDMDVIELRQPSQGSRDGIAVHHRQADVQEDHVRCELRRDRDCGAAVMGEPGDVAQMRHRHVEHLRGIQVVFDDQHAKVAPLPQPAAVRPSATTRACGTAMIGRRISTSVPWPGPGLLIAIRPSCISTSRRASVNPMPRPPADRSRIGSACWNMSNTRGKDVGGDSDPRIADAHHRLIGLLVRGEPDAARREA